MCGEALVWRDDMLTLDVGARNWFDALCLPVEEGC